MDTLKTFTFFLFSFLCLFTLCAAATTDLCSKAACHWSEPMVRFPFRLKNLQSRSCGYPGFDLSCDAAKRTLLHLPGSGAFTVHSIDYGAQEIWINDPGHCLPARLLSLNLSSSIFKGVMVQDVTLFNCSSSSDYTAYGLNPIGCLSGSSHSVSATSSARAVGLLSASCGKVATVEMPVQWVFPEQAFSSELTDDLRLTWAAPRCGRCELHGGRCGRKSNSSLEIVCSNFPHHGLPKGARYAVSIGAGVPVMLFIIRLACFICGRLKSYGRRRQRRGPMVEFTSSSVAPQPTAATAGLDEPTIESLPKVVLGESRRLPKPNYNTCPICLSEYRPKETLRSLPGCQHCFHVGMAIVTEIVGNRIEIEPVNTGKNRLNG